jgi:hypothetical protein
MGAAISFRAVSVAGWTPIGNSVAARARRKSPAELISLSRVLFLMIVVVFVALAALDGCTAHASCACAVANRG